MSELPMSVRIREVGPRDGLQNEPEVLATDVKVRLIELLADTGVSRIELTSFVRPEVISQLADAGAVLERVVLPDHVSASVLIPNARSSRRSRDSCPRRRPTIRRTSLARASARGAAGGRVDSAFPHSRGHGLANVLAALEAGIDSFESSFGELGGCPVPAGATGNIASEDLVSMLEEMGVATGVDLPKLLDAARAAQVALGRPLGSHLLTAGPVNWR
jgi:isopropylmalate/homocitrate/citramalate synthase